MNLVKIFLILLFLGGTGVAYTRWGKSTCPTGTGAQLVYSGRAGGTHYTSRGGAAEKICLPENPDYLAGTAEFSGFVSVVHGAEYEVQLGPNANLNEQNVPCAVCYVPVRAAALVVPAKTVCPTSWTREYHGYLMTERDPHYRSSYNCIDINAEGIQGSSTNMNGALFYYTYTMCNGFDCPPYENRRILSCAVCTK